MAVGTRRSGRGPTRRPSASKTRLLLLALLAPLSLALLWILASQSIHLAQARRDLDGRQSQKEALQQAVSEAGARSLPVSAEPEVALPSLERFLGATQYLDSSVAVIVKELQRSTAPGQLSRIALLLQGDPNVVAGVLSSLEQAPTCLVLTSIAISVKSGDPSITVWNLSGVLP